MARCPHTVARAGGRSLAPVAAAVLFAVLVALSGLSALVVQGTSAGAGTAPAALSASVPDGPSADDARSAVSPAVARSQRDAGGEPRTPAVPALAPAPGSPAAPLRLAPVPRAAEPSAPTRPVPRHGVRAPPSSSGD
ncbi:hypothetical protein JHN52_22795 [Streptomyces sp. MBT97]|uniref:hypothetical protein n=1 Tax=Streptomyces sp. MBT97 TaxID=2800411 RepID=UPI00190C821C|nr:hypothetical protein [Streptomyces sp. MBT97]MBK3635703.1 hypothetical protein [Streptomyces sp. MBT97]